MHLKNCLLECKASTQTKLYNFIIQSCTCLLRVDITSILALMEKCMYVTMLSDDVNMLTSDHVT